MAVQTTPKSTPTTTRKPPAYRQRTGYTQAIVTLTDAITKRRKDYWLGESIWPPVSRAQRPRDVRDVGVPRHRDSTPPRRRRPTRTRRAKWRR